MNWWSGLISFVSVLILNIGRLLGRKEATDALSNEQKRRIELADAARADADEYADGGVRDPRQRD